MQVENLIHKKGRKIFFFLSFLFFAVSCVTDLSRHGRVTLHSTADKDSFVFSVSDEFLQQNPDSPKNSKLFNMSDAELRLLEKLLKQKKYCLGTFGSPNFTITSRQEKIYDMTFAHLIEKNYNARSVAPRMYFGQCKKS
jgi:ABC-type oligopeptide transport system substrate-binding subunit